MPAWNDLVKGAVYNELAPTDPDWFYTRCASVARHLYVRRAGVGALSKVYGGKSFQLDHWLLFIDRFSLFASVISLIYIQKRIYHLSIHLFCFIFSKLFFDRLISLD